MIVPEQVIDLIEPFNFKSMYELGNKKRKGIPFSIFYKSKDIEYTSLDLNGMDGSIILDLSKPTDLPSRDMVANIGTSEHVMDQESVFRNVHNLSHFRMIHWTPQAKIHPRHGYWGYEKEFFIMLAKLNNYIIEKLYIDISFNSYGFVLCSYRKQGNDKFVWSPELPLYKNKNGKGGVRYR